VSLRDLIDAKQRRTARLPILVGDPGPAMAEVAQVQEALQAHMESVGGREPTEDEAAREAQLRADAQAALERQAAMIVWVDLQSLPDDEWDGMTGDLEPGENGLPDLTPDSRPAAGGVLYRFGVAGRGVVGGGVEAPGVDRRRSCVDHAEAVRAEHLRAERVAGKRLRRDSLHAARMAYCGPKGIELDAFLRWSRRSQQAALDWQAFEGRGAGTAAHTRTSGRMTSSPTTRT
jgi:hypothetical protein